MSAGEGELVELFGCLPASGNLGGWRGKLGAPCFERDAIAGDGVFHYVDRFLRGDAKILLLVGRVSPLRAVRYLLSCGAHGVTRPAVGADFDARKFPEVRVDDSGGALVDEVFAIACDDEGDEVAFGGGFAFGEVGELVLKIFFSRDAEFLHGAGGAVR